MWPRLQVLIIYQCENITNLRFLWFNKKCFESSLQNISRKAYYSLQLYKVCKLFVLFSVKPLVFLISSLHFYNNFLKCSENKVLFLNYKNIYYTA